MRKVSILLMLIAFLPSFIISQFYGQQRFYDGNGIDPYRGYGGWRRQQQFPTYYDYDEPRFRGPPPPPPQFQNPYSKFILKNGIRLTKKFCINSF